MSCIKKNEILSNIAEIVWQNALDGEQGILLRLSSGLPITTLPDISYQAAEESATCAQELLNRLSALVTDNFSHEDWLTLEILRSDLQMQVERLKFYWLDFPVTPYTGGYQLNFIHQGILAAPISSHEERQAYLGLLKGYAGLLAQMKTKLQEQSERGILLPKPALPGILGLFGEFRDKASEIFIVDIRRLNGISNQAKRVFISQVEVIISQKIVPTFDELLDFMGLEYLTNAPEKVGLHQYPKGNEYYRYLVRLYTVPDETPETLFSYGIKRVAEIAAELKMIRDRLGFTGTQEKFLEQLKTDQRFSAKTSREIEQRFNNYIRRIEPLIDNYFSTKPKAPYGVRRLNAAQETSMTYGFYQPPSKHDPSGQYRYNASNLKNNPMITAGHLIYHELVPGHHFHMALQQENEKLPLIRSKNFSLTLGGFHEGWAEYAANLAAEMGLLDDPYDKYGHLLMEMFLTVRLVVDPGLNYFGWSLQKAQEYMKENCFLSDGEIESETIRYATALPGQSLGYKLGHKIIHELRKQAENKLGTLFDIRWFHSHVLGSGAMRLEILQKNIEWHIKKLLYENTHASK